MRTLVDTPPVQGRSPPLAERPFGRADGVCFLPTQGDMPSPHKIDPQVRGRLLEIFDGLPETQTYGLVLACHEAVEVVRPPSGHDEYVLLQLVNRKEPEDVPFWKKSAFWKQFGEATANCLGAGAAGIGAVGLAAAMPVSGGLSGIPAALAWGGAVAGAAQCGVSVGKTINLGATNDEKVNDALTDRSNGVGATFYYTMYTIDIVGTASAAVSLTQFTRAGHHALRANRLGAQTTSAQRTALAKGLNMSREQVELAARWGTKHVAKAGKEIVRKKMLDGLSALGGLAGQFYFGGVLKDISDIVFAIIQLPSQAPKPGEAYWKS